MIPPFSVRQVKPGDAFGQMMVRNIATRGCPLLVRMYVCILCVWNFRRLSRVFEGTFLECSRPLQSVLWQLTEVLNREVTGRAGGGVRPLKPFQNVPTSNAVTSRYRGGREGGREVPKGLASEASGLHPTVNPQPSTLNRESGASGSRPQGKANSGHGQEEHRDMSQRQKLGDVL